MATIRLLLPRIIFVAAIGPLALVVAYFATADKAVTYDATVKLLVDQPQTIGATAGFTNISKLQQLVPTYAQIVMSYSTAESGANRVPETSALNRPGFPGGSII